VPPVGKPWAKLYVVRVFYHMNETDRENTVCIAAQTLERNTGMF